MDIRLTETNGTEHTGSTEAAGIRELSEALVVQREITLTKAGGKIVTVPQERVSSIVSLEPYED